MPTAPTILEIATAYFRDQRWPFEVAGDRPLLRIAFMQGEQSWQCYAEAREAQGRFLFYSVAPVVVPEALRAAAAEFVTRANYGLAVGNFELDLDDGEVRFKTSIDVTGDRLTYALVKQLVMINLRVLLHYLPGLTALLAGTSAGEAIARLEG